MGVDNKVELKALLIRVKVLMKDFETSNNKVELKALLIRVKVLMKDFETPNCIIYD